MPKYRFKLINLGHVEGIQDVELPDDAAAVKEQYDGMDVSSQLRKGHSVRWIELTKLLPNGRTKPI